MNRLNLLVFLFALSGCRPAPPAPGSLAFYHWQTRLALQSSETAFLDALGCRKLYVKYLDVARDPLGGAIRPYALLDVADTTGLGDREVVPCVFLTNSVFENISETELDWLAGKTAAALGKEVRRREGEKARDDGVGEEYQFDCDWTGSTRAAFFSFLKKIRAKLPPRAVLSATIRLHQYKFPVETGVPPADRGMLMLYNTGDIDDWAAEHSIFRPADAEKYLTGATAAYPLPLDVALPLFSWTLVYRDAELWKIIPELPPAELAPPKMEPLTTNRFRVREATLLAGHYLRPGDLLRVETVDSALLWQAAGLAAALPVAPGATVAFYHLDTNAVRRFSPAFLKKIWERTGQ